MFTEFIESLKQCGSSVPLLEEECVFDDFHPDILELAALKRESFESQY